MYRPISVLPVGMETFEPAVCDQLDDNLLDHNLFALHQSGFHKKHSTNTVLLEFTDYAYKQMDHSRLAGVIDSVYCGNVD